MKNLRAVCWGCGRVGTGMKRCGGGGGGAVVTCGTDCQAKAWAEGHKHWCGDRGGDGARGPAPQQGPYPLPVSDPRDVVVSAPLTGCRSHMAIALHSVFDTSYDHTER